MSVSQSKGNVNTKLSCSAAATTMTSMASAVGHVGTHKVNAIRDAGCTCVIVNRKFVSDDEMVGKTARCRLMDGYIMSAPVARVHIDTPYYSGEVEAMCVDNPVGDLLVGNIPCVKYLSYEPQITDGPEPEEHVAQVVQTRAQKEK
jgi:hypothetical protein